MKARIILVIFLGAGALAYLVRVRLPENFFLAAFIVTGCLGIVNAILLRFNVVKPGVVWGDTASGMALLGLGMLLMAFGGDYESHLGAVLGTLVPTLGLISFIGGLLLENKARRMRMRSRAAQQAAAADERR